MKKILCFIIFILIFTSNLSAEAHYYRHGSCSSCIYVVHTDYSQQEQGFQNCKEHYLVSERTVNYYSNGSRRTFYNHTVYNSDGSIFIDNCSDISHIIYGKKHYFLAKKDGSYKLISDKGELISKRKYSYMKELLPNRILVRADKKYGIIDLSDNVIVPIKYKNFEQRKSNLFLTKLNGYWGMIDSSNNILLPNEYDKIKPLYDTYILKKQGKYGLADIDGKLILDTRNSKIKRLGEYIIVKDTEGISVYNSAGKILTDKKYKKVRLERNVLQGWLKNEKWTKIL